MDELQMVWYKMLCRLPHSPTYGIFRDCMEQAVASTYGNGSSKLKKVQEIMRQAGIVSGSYIECGNEFNLTVYDKNGEPYDDYSLEINGRHSSGALWWKEEEDIHQEHTINSSEPYELNLPNGTYVCEVRDNAENVGFGESKSQSLTLKVSNNNTTTDAECITGFGSDYVAAPGAQLTVLDAYGNDFKDYEATAIANGQNTEINNGVLNLAEHNNYRVLLKNKKGKVTYYDTFTLRIKNGGNTSITKKTEFVGGSIIKGKVVDSETENPLSGVKVQYTNQNNPDETGSVMTDGEGYFDIGNLKEGRIKISFSLEGYTEVSTEKDVNSEPQEYDLGAIQMKKADLETQLKVIADNYSQWNRIDTITIPRSSFTVTDINNNGRIEIIVSGTYGTGFVSENYVFEVNDDISGLIECSFTTENAPDIQDDESAEVYLVNGNYMIACRDGNPHGTQENHVILQAMSLQNTDIVVDTLGSGSWFYSFDGSTKEEYYDKDGNPISKDEYEGLFDSTYSGYPKGEMKFKWVPLYGAESNLQARLKESWEGFSCSLFE